MFSFSNPKDPKSSNAPLPSHGQNKGQGGDISLFTGKAKPPVYIDFGLDIKPVAPNHPESYPSTTQEVPPTPITETHFNEPSSVRSTLEAPTVEREAFESPQPQYDSNEYQGSYVEPSPQQDDWTVRTSAPTPAPERYDIPYLTETTDLPNLGTNSTAEEDLFYSPPVMSLQTEKPLEATDWYQAEAASLEALSPEAVDWAITSIADEENPLWSANQASHPKTAALPPIYQQPALQVPTEPVNPYYQPSPKSASTQAMPWVATSILEEAVTEDSEFAPGFENPPLSPSAVQPPSSPIHPTHPQQIPIDGNPQPLTQVQEHSKSTHTEDFLEFEAAMDTTLFETPTESPLKQHQESPIDPDFQTEAASDWFVGAPEETIKAPLKESIEPFYSPPEAPAGESISELALFAPPSETMGLAEDLSIPISPTPKADLESPIWAENGSIETAEPTPYPSTFPEQPLEPFQDRETLELLLASDSDTGFETQPLLPELSREESFMIPVETPPKPHDQDWDDPFLIPEFTDEIKPSSPSLEIPDTEALYPKDLDHWSEAPSEKHSLQPESLLTDLIENKVIDEERLPMVLLPPSAEPTYDAAFTDESLIQTAIPDDETQFPETTVEAVHREPPTAAVPNAPTSEPKHKTHESDEPFEVLRSLDLQENARLFLVKMNDLYAIMAEFLPLYAEDSIVDVLKVFTDSNFNYLSAPFHAYVNDCIIPGEQHYQIQLGPWQGQVVLSMDSLSLTAEMSEDV